MISFAIGHFLYMIIFFYGKRKPIKRSYLSTIMLFLIFLIIIATGTYQIYELWNKLEYFLVPIVIYTYIIGVMEFAAISRYGLTSSRSFWTVFIGAVLFAISDTLIGHFKFNRIKSNFAQTIIMITYYLSQYFIMTGTIEGELVQFN